MKAKIIPVIVTFIFCFFFAKGQDTLEKEKYIELIRYNKSHESVAVSTIKKNRNVKVYYFKDGKTHKLKGNLIEINDSTIVVESTYYLFDVNPKATVQIDSISSICRKKPVWGIPFIIPGGTLTSAGIVLLYYGITDQFFTLIGYSSLGCLFLGFTFTYIGIPLTTIGIITACSWRHFDTAKGWEISVKEKTIK